MPREDDLLEIEERKKDRARMLLDRYGIVFRELLQREAPGFRWADVFRPLRLMELSGEVNILRFTKSVDMVVNEMHRIDFVLGTDLINLMHCALIICTLSNCQVTLMTE